MRTAHLPAPTPPVLVWESGDLYAFESVEGAERSLEPTDVKDGIYKGFDATGRLLRLDVRNEREKLLLLLPVRRERVVISLAEETPSHREECAGILAHFLAAAGEAQDAVSRMNFDELVTNASRVSKAIR